MRIFGFSILIALISTSSIHAEPAAEQQVLDAVKAPDLTVVHLCSSRTEAAAGLE
jgi:hypothetical protein